MGPGAPLAFTVTTREIGGKLWSHIVLELPDPPTDDQESAIEHASVEGEQASPEFLRMVAAWEKAQGEETPELEAATAALVSALGRRPCPCGSGRFRRDCCGE
jgi:uncharacterized protein YecA (UPF0149 family)